MSKFCEFEDSKPWTSYYYSLQLQISMPLALICISAPVKYTCVKGHEKCVLQGFLVISKLSKNWFLVQNLNRKQIFPKFLLVTKFKEIVK